MWMRALDVRNRMAHTYDQAAFDTAIIDIAGHFLPAMEGLLAMMEQVRVAGESGA